MRTFNGFPAGKSTSVQVPTLFFSELLGLIDDLAELKLTVYCFWALQQREGKYRYVRLRDMLDDSMFLSGLDNQPERAKMLLQSALAKAVERGTLLHVVVPQPQNDEHLYFMNTEKGRTAVEALAQGDWTPGDSDIPVALIKERPNIFALYEQNIGPLTPIISDILRDAESMYPSEWVLEAMTIAVENNVRNWRYVESILRRWVTEGKTAPRKPTDDGPSSPYLQDDYFRDEEIDS
jgi:DNA replication protein